MTYNSDIRTAVQLSAEARAAAMVSSTGYALSQYLPDHENYGLSFNFDVNATALAEVASYRSYDTEADFGVTDGSEARSGKLPPISRQYRVTEYEQLSLYGNGDALGAELERYARRAGAAIAARVEFARGEAIEFGKVTLDERGLKFTIDYGRKASHSVTAATLWTDPAADPIADLDAWAGVWRASNGGTPAVRFSPRVMSALQKNPAIIKHALQRGTDLPSRVSQADVRSVLADNGYTDVGPIDEVIGGNRVVSDAKVIFVPGVGSGGQVFGSGTTSGVTLDGGPLGTTDWGIPAESINPTYGIPDSDRPGIFAGNFTQFNPEGSYVLGSAIALPILVNANGTFAAAVVAP